MFYSASISKRVTVCSNTTIEAAMVLLHSLRNCVKKGLDIMSISNLPRPSAKFIRTDNAANKASDDLFAAYVEGNWTPATFMSPKNGGTMSLGDYNAFRLDIARFAKVTNQETGKLVDLLSPSEKKWFVLYESEANGLAFKKAKRNASKPVAAAMQADLDSGKKLVARRFGEYKRKAEAFDRRKNPATKTANKTAPTLERLERDGNKMLGWIEKDTDLANRIQLQKLAKQFLEALKTAKKQSK